MIKIFVIALFVSNILLTQLTEIHAQQNEPLKESLSNQSRVGLKIHADKDIKDLVRSYITTELSSIKDIRIADDNYDWVLSIVALSLKSNIGHEISVAVSSAVLEPFDVKSLITVLEKHGALFSAQKEILNAYDDYFFIKAHQIETGSHEDLKSICKKIVTDFDINYLEPKRKEYQSHKLGIGLIVDGPLFLTEVTFP